MLKESFRVLKKGGRVAFGVWGSREKSKLMTILPQIVKKYGFETDQGRTPFHLADNKEQLDKDLQNAGFSNIIYYNQFCPFLTYEKQDIENLTRFLTVTGNLKNVHDEEIKNKIIDEFIQTVYDLVHEQKQPIGLDVMVILAQKK